VATTCRSFFVALLLVAFVDAEAQQSGSDPGEQMYRDGILPSGDPMTAIVAGDVPIVGTQFSCESCHGRSGMGASEGAYVVPPVAGPFLLEPSPQPKRPAYDTDSMARLLREGVTPSGRELPVELMPRYELSDSDVAVLTNYLSTLSDGNSPGVDDTVIRFATVVTDGADPAESEAVVSVLDRFAVEINRETRNDGERWDRGYTPESRLPTVFREWVFDEWRLSGPPETWRGQLEKYYRAAPAFALVGGLGPWSWGPISKFCEREEIPCLFPATDRAHAEPGDFYTYYFSRGLGLEADLVGEHLASDPVNRVIQLYCDPGLESGVASFGKALEKGAGTVEQHLIDCSSSAGDAGLSSLLSDADTALVLWLNPGQLQELAPDLPASRLYVSSTLLGDAAIDVMASLTRDAFLAHPYRLPGRIDPAMRRFELWAKTRDVAITHPRKQSAAFFACLALRHAVKHVGRFFVREFVLDVLDHSQNLSAYVPNYERPTFGPQQRFLSKGGYVLPVKEGRTETDNAEWILP
jgi:hypothetical protein